MSEYQSRFEAILLGFGEAEQSDYRGKKEARKVFDEMFEKEIHRKHSMDVGNTNDQVFNISSLSNVTTLLPITPTESAFKDGKSEEESDVKVLVEGSVPAVQPQLTATSLIKEAANIKKEAANIEQELVPEHFHPILQHLAHKTDTEHLEKIMSKHLDRNTSNLPGIALDIRGALKLHHFSFSLVGNLYIVTLGGTVLVICIWDPGNNPKTMNLNGHTETLETQLLLRFTGKFCLCKYSAFMTRVWDLGRQRDISSHSTELATRPVVLPWRKRLIVLLLALYAESNGMFGRMDYSVSTLYSRRAFATFGFKPESMDMVEKWLGKASMLQSIRSTSAKDFKVTKYYVLARSKGNNIIQQLQEKTNVVRSSGQQDVATVGEMAKSQSIGWNTSNSSLHQEVQVHNQLHCAKLDKNMSRNTVDLPRFPFDPGGLLNLEFNSKQKRLDTRIDAKISMLLYLNLEDKVLFEDGVLL
ncbi:hypothetical protein A4A49_31420 [Nicotiana attenuata]|uniref:Uncharacterized protein n=1 Tax=Nicotiana attenuata TaxID=49451 RepID=A0A1J6KRW2_NICAT|nr:hypothetical protein A4A49_31420 [Nicotiana attenuata]